LMKNGINSEQDISKGQLDQKQLQADIPRELMKNGINSELMPRFRQLDISKGQLDPASLQTDMKPEQVLKEIQALLSGKSGGEKENNPAFQQKYNRMIKPNSSGTTDQNQVAGADVKGRGTLAGLDVVKAKSNFKNLPTYVTHQVGKSLVRAINHGENTLKIQLKPPELGRLVMHIDNTGNSMKVSIMTENQAAKEMLSANVNELRTVLSSAGISLESFDVDMNSNFKQSMADAKNQSNTFGGKKKENLNQAGVSQPEMGDGDQGTVLSMQNGTLHYVA
jgi:flagellar hook-length control protein FliK